MMSNRRHVGVDFDGTLAEYGAWCGIHHTGAPIAKMVEKVKKLLADGVKVTIFTARVTCAGDYAGDSPVEARTVIEQWCRDVFGTALPVTNIKGDFTEIWDDRGVGVLKNTGMTLQEHVIEMLKLSEEDASEEQESYAQSKLRQLREYFQVLPPC